MSTSCIPSFIKINQAVLEKKLTMWKFTDGRRRQTDDGRCAMTIANLSFWLRWAKNHWVLMFTHFTVSAMDYKNNRMHARTRRWTDGRMDVRTHGQTDHYRAPAFCDIYCTNKFSKALLRFQYIPRLNFCWTLFNTAAFADLLNIPSTFKAARKKRRGTVMNKIVHGTNSRNTSVVCSSLDS